MEEKGMRICSSIIWFRTNSLSGQNSKERADYV